MAPRAIQFARRGATGVPLIISGKYKTGEAIVKGSPLLIDANGELTLHPGGASAEVSGIALEAAGSRPGYDAANSPTVVTGRKQEISYIAADAETIYSIQLSADAGATITDVAQTHIGEEYGIVIDTNGSGAWLLDTTETTTKIFEIVDIDTDLNVAFVKFMAVAIGIGV